MTADQKIVAHILTSTKRILSPDYGVLWITIQSVQLYSMCTNSWNQNYGITIGLTKMESLSNGKSFLKWAGGKRFQQNGLLTVMD